MTTEILKPTARDLISRLPNGSVSLIGISSDVMSQARERGFIHNNMRHIQRLLHGENFDQNLERSLYETLAYTKRLEGGDTPLLAIVIATNNNIEMGRIIRVVDTTEETLNSAKQKVLELIEDNFGEIEMKTRRFSKPQLPAQA